MHKGFSFTSVNMCEWGAVESKTGHRDTTTVLLTAKYYFFIGGFTSQKLNTAAATKFNDEQLNFFSICYVVTDVLAEGLRIIFKQEWDNRYKATWGEWKDEPRNGLYFYKGESPQNRRRNAKLLATLKNGNRAEWDCTVLFFAILHSDCIGNKDLSIAVKHHVNDLREFRNDFAHITRGHLSDLEFQNAITKVCVAFQALGLSTLRIEEIRFQTFSNREVGGLTKSGSKRVFCLFVCLFFYFFPFFFSSFLHRIQYL